MDGCGMPRPTWDEYFISLAKFVAERGTCPRLKVGAVLVHTETHRVLSTGYNGAPPEEPHCTEVGCDMVGGHCVRTIHAEENAIDWAATRLPPHLRINSTLYCTHLPCLPCFCRALLAGVKRIVYVDDYNSDILSACEGFDVEVIKFNE